MVMLVSAQPKYPNYMHMLYIYKYIDHLCLYVLGAYSLHFRLRDCLVYMVSLV